MDADAASDFLLHHLQHISLLLVTFVPHACWPSHFAPLECQGAAEAIHDTDEVPPRIGHETADVLATMRLGRGMPPGAATVPLLPGSKNQRHGDLRRSGSIRNQEEAVVAAVVDQERLESGKRNWRRPGSRDILPAHPLCNCRRR